MRRAQPYETYSEHKFSIPMGKNGGAMIGICWNSGSKESVVVKQAIKKLEYTVGDDVLVRKFICKETMKNSMEALIHHFKLYTEGFQCLKAVYILA